MTEPRKRSKRYLCKCTSYCTTLNPDTRIYEGVGRWLTFSTRHAHMKHDQYKRLEDARRDQPPISIRLTTVSSIIRSILQEVSWLSDLPVTSPGTLLSFVHEPNTSGDLAEGSGHPNDVQLELKQNIRANYFLLFTEKRYSGLLDILSKMPPSDDRDEAAGLIHDSLKQLTDSKRLAWLQQRGRIPGKIVVNTDVHFKQEPLQPIVKATFILSLVLENMYFMTRRALRVHLGGVRGVLRANGATLDTIASVPKDPRTCSTPFNLDPVSRQYINCVKCHCLYPYTMGNDETDHITNSHCTYRSTPTSSECQTPLWMPRQLTGNTWRHVPKRKYYHQELKAWIGRLLSRKGMEELLDRPIPPAEPDAPVDDIWSSKVFSDLKGPNGELFYPGPVDECRLIFGISVDGFVPFGGKTQNVSSTGIWLVLFNLPWHLRHLPQNIFLVGVIPGPDKPAKEELNHYLQLLVNDALELWTPGVYFSRTYRYRLGRLSRAMIVPAICDHPGLRQVIGYASGSTAHYMCVECDVDKDDIHIVDRREWPIKDPSHIRRFATLWKNAQSEEERQDIFDACGWRWSALFDLPYWNPVLFSVVDSMHALDLNLFNHHCRTLFGIDLEHTGGDRSSLQSTTTHGPKVLPETDSSVKDCRSVVQANDPKMLYRLLEFKRPVLYTVCIMFNIVESGRSQVIGTRWVLARSIHTWRQVLPDEAIFENDNNQIDETIPHPNSHDDSEENNADILQQLSKNPLKGARVIGHLLFQSDVRKDLESSRAKAFREAWTDLYVEICRKLSIVLPANHKRKKMVLQNEILASIGADVAKRRRLARFKPPAMRSNIFDSDTDTEAGTDMDTDTESRMSIESQPESRMSIESQPESRMSIDSESRMSVDSQSESRMDTDTETEAETDTDQLLLQLNGKRKRLNILSIKNFIVTNPSEKVQARLLAFNYGTLELFRAICDTLDITLDPSKQQKADFHAAILETIDGDQHKYQQLRSLLPASKHDAVLGRDVMQQIWKDMANTQLPTWVSPAPRNWGTAKRGTLSADNWRVICTIHLPVTLIWLWRDEVGRKRDLLRNFMDLVTAARIACLRVSSPGQIAAYDKYITRYADGIQRLYPSVKLKPTLHTAIHIGDGLEKFGPDHTHNASFYERFISFFHRINTNNKLGEVESTFLKSSARYSNLCALLADDEILRNNMADMINAIDSIKQEDLRGFRLASILDPNMPDFNIRSNTLVPPLDRDVVAALDILQRAQGLHPVSTEAFIVSEVALRNVRYGSFNSRHFRNSAIIYRLHEDSQNTEKRTGIIHMIFRQTCEDNGGTERIQLYLVVEEHAPIKKLGLEDPYLAFGFAAGYLCERNATMRRVISLDQVISHFVMTNLPDTEHFHALPIDRLMLSFDLNEA